MFFQYLRSTNRALYVEKFKFKQFRTLLNYPLETQETESQKRWSDGLSKGHGAIHPYPFSFEHQRPLKERRGEILPLSLTRSATLIEGKKKTIRHGSRHVCDNLIQCDPINYLQTFRIDWTF